LSSEQFAHQVIEQAGNEERRAVAQLLHGDIGQSLAARTVIGDDVLVALHRLSQALRSTEAAGKGRVSLERLTERQRQVLQMIAEGRTTREMAQTLHLSVKTIESHRAKLMNELGIRDVAGLVVYAIRSGVIGIDRILSGNRD
jgi:DNA-binding NarL/FixJ family response regulator